MMMAKRRSRNPVPWDTRDFQDARDAYEAFHGAEPVYADEMDYPEPPEVAWVIGRAYAISYIPERGSRKGEIYEHRWGDTGRHLLRNKPLLAVSSDGEFVFLINDKSQYKVTERGIVG